MSGANPSAPVVCFGEVLLRLCAPGFEKILQSPHFDVHVGGAEANVAVSLAQFGLPVEMATVLPQNPLGDAARHFLRGHGVGVSNVASAPGRMGLYFVSSGAVVRPTEITYDRARSAFAEADILDWEKILGSARWLHVSGVTPAVSAGAAANALAAVKAAAALGIEVSFDGNYREQMWRAWRGDGPGVLAEIMNAVTIAFINAADIGLILGRDFGTDPDVSRTEACKAAFDRWPRLQMIAATQRDRESVLRQRLSAYVVDRSGERKTRGYVLDSIVDRIGGGDAFAAGVIYSRVVGGEARAAVEFGLAAAAYKHSIPGDSNIATVADVERVMSDGGADIRR